MTTNVLMDVAFDGIRTNVAGLDPEEDLLPMLICNTPENDISLTGLGMSMNSEDEKDALAAVITASIAVHRASEAVFVTTAWRVSIPRGEAHPGDLSVHPDREEIIMVVHATRSGETAYHATLTRHPDRAPELGAWETEPTTEPIEGRFPTALRFGLGMTNSIPDDIVAVLDQTAGDEELRTALVNMLAQKILMWMTR